MLKHAALVLCCLASPALSQQMVVLSPCWDGIEGGASQTEAEMAAYLEGTWRMSANGTGFTLGTNVMPVSLSHNNSTGQLNMGGGGGPTVVLHPLRSDNAPFDMSTEALSPGKLSKNEIEVLNGCANPARYFWQMGKGTQKSWGALMFLEGDIATGFMANSAGGSRSVVMTR